MIEETISKLFIPHLIEIRKEIAPLPGVNVDPAHLGHALLNIANNAIMAMKANGTLTFRAYEEEGNACIEIEDTGPGIRPEEKELIFEPLYSSKPKGTGFGLPLARMLIDNNKGKIAFTSEEGQGTMFKILIPIP